MAFNLKKLENQAVLSVILAIVGGVCAVGGIGIILWKFKWQQFMLPFRASGMLQPAVLGSLALSIGIGIAGFGVGFNSAGEKRNSKSRLSWIGFFLNAGVLALALIAAVFFMIVREPIRGG